jgi:hypothetical protein
MANRTAVEIFKNASNIASGSNNLTFDGTVLNITGRITSSGDILVNDISELRWINRFNLDNFIIIYIILLYNNIILMSYIIILIIKLTHNYIIMIIILLL